MRNRLLFLAVLAGMLGAQPGPVNPNAARALWRSLKNQLSSANGEEYFRTQLQNADLPVLMGTLLSATPTDRPAQLVLNLSGDRIPEATLLFRNENRQDGHLDGPLAPGSQIQFRGVPVAFTREPFMLTFEVNTAAAKP